MKMKGDKSLCWEEIAVAVVVLLLLCTDAAQPQRVVLQTAGREAGIEELQCPTHCPCCFEAFLFD